MTTEGERRAAPEGVRANEDGIFAVAARGCELLRGTEAACMSDTRTSDGGGADICAGRESNLGGVARRDMEGGSVAGGIVLEMVGSPNTASSADSGVGIVAEGGFPS